MAGMKASLCQILSRRAIRKRPKVVNQVGLIAARESNICPIHLRFASQQIKDCCKRRTRQNSLSQPHLIAEELIEMASAEPISVTVPTVGIGVRAAAAFGIPRTHAKQNQPLHVV